MRLDHDWRRKGDARGQVIEAGIEGRPSTGGAPVIVCVLFRYDFFVARETPCVAGVPAHAPWIERERERPVQIHLRRAFHDHTRRIEVRVIGEVMTARETR